MSVESGEAIPTTTYGVYTAGGTFLPVRYSETWNGETTTVDLEPLMLDVARRLNIITEEQTLADI